MTDLPAIAATRHRPLDRLLSGDRPGGVLLNAVMLAVLLALALAPFLFPGTRSVAVAARICIFVVLAASYDVMLGYTGIASFAHSMFFGIGAYGVAIALGKLDAGWGAVLLGAAIGVALSVAGAAVIRLLSDPLLGVRLDGRIVTYYLVFALSLVLFLSMLRIVNSPFGRVLQAIRENEFRAEALGYRIVVYRTLAGALSAAMAALAGAMLALLLHYNGPAATLSFDLMLDILLMVVIGGMGTLYGPALGAVVLVMAEYYLQPAMGALSGAVTGWPLLPTLFHPDRWLLWLGVFFVLIVYFFPTGIVGKLRERRG